jgi:hypothetical protein
MAWPIAYEIAITVAAGSGFAPVAFNGEVDWISFIPPSGTPTFDYEITRQSELDPTKNHGFDGRIGLRAQQTIELRKASAGLHTVHITNTAGNGVWLVLIAVKNQSNQ